MNTQTGRTRRAKILREATAFFHANAGYGYDPKTETAEQGRKRCAVSLARAERDARSAGITFEWGYDPDGCIGCDCGQSDCKCSTGEDHEVLDCVARDRDGVIVASLGAICEPSREYRRVVEAELAQEALSFDYGMKSIAHRGAVESKQG